MTLNRQRNQNPRLLLDNLNVGMLVTVQQGELIFPQIQSNPFSPPTRSKTPIEDTFLNGVPLQVRAINLPYIVAKILGGNNQEIILDVRKFRIIQISKAYAAASRKVISRMRGNAEKSRTKKLKMITKKLGLPTPERQ